MFHGLFIAAQEALKTNNGGQGGIRTRETFNRLHTFQACAFNRSATCPSFKRPADSIE